MPIRHRLPNISPNAYQHPADRAATAALQSIPMLDEVVRAIHEFGFERAYRQYLLANSVKIGPKQLPHIWNSYQDVLQILDMPKEYDLYIMQTPVANAFAFGSKEPIIVLNSGLVSLLDEAQVQSVIAHEVGHILSDHVLYRTMLILLLSIGRFARLPILVGLPVEAIRLALLEWFRAAELSSDRAATLVVRDPLIVCRTMMNLAGGSTSEKLNLDAFIKQATDYEEWEDAYDRLVRFFPELYTTHPFPVRRVSELMKWVQSGDFDRIIRGEYTKRDDDIHVSKEATDAFEHYKERFQNAFKEIDYWVRNNGKKRKQKGRQKA
jgi:Zn-dependent protease with chaperone function